MKKIILLLALSLSTMAHCPLDFPKLNLCADLQWIDGPHLGKNSAFEVTFWEKGDATHTEVILDQDVNIYSWMIMDNGHSHGGPKMTWNLTDDGSYRVENAKFFMGHMKGYWEVRIDISNEGDLISRDGVRVEF